MLPMTSAIASWLAISEIASKIVDTNERITLPMVRNEDDVQHPNLMNFAEQWDGSEWLRGPLRCNPNLKEDAIRSSDPMIVHMNLFFDGFTEMDTKSKQKKLSVLSISAGEVPKEFRGSGCPLGHIPLAVWQKNEFTIDEVLSCFDEEVRSLSEGVDVYSVALDKTFKIFAFPALIIGDYPARHCVGGLCEAANSRRPCTFCEGRFITVKQ